VNALVFIPPGGLNHSASEVNSLHSRTDENGEFLIEEVPAGEHIVVAFHPGYFLDAMLANVLPNEVTELRFGLLPIPGIPDDWIIHLLDADTNNPIPNGEVHIPVSPWFEPGSEFDPWFGTSNSAGDSTITGVPTGNWGVTCTADGYDGSLVPLIDEGKAEKAPGAPSTITIYLTPQEQTTSVDDWMLY